VPAGETVDPMQALMPELVNEQTVQAMKEYVNHGGGLLLTGISGLYAMVLGVEETMPNSIRENSYITPVLAAGIASADGFEQHPVFKNLPAEGFFTTCNFPYRNLLTECAWKARVPSGSVIANEFVEYKKGDDPNNGSRNRIGEYAAIVEYSHGKGKIMVLGGRSCDFTPLAPYPGEHSDFLRKRGRGTLRDQMRKLMLNALIYCTGPSETDLNRQKF